MNDNKKDIKLIAFDMDGTLVNDNRELPADFIPWVKRHPEIKVVIASGRPCYTNEQLFHEILDQIAIIGDNGATMSENGSIIYQNPMSQEQILYGMKQYENVPGTEIVLCGTKAAYMHKPNHQPLFQSQIDTYFWRHEYYDDLYQALEKDEIVKFSVFFENENAVGGLEQIREIPEGMEITVGAKAWLDMSKPDSTKGDALSAYGKKNQIVPKEMMAFGDFLNDLSMLNFVGESYAMENAHPLVKEASKYIAPSNNEEGAMQVLYKVIGK